MIVIVLLVGFVYVRGARGVLPARRIASFLAGLMAIAVALSPQMQHLAARRFSVHMTQHMVLLMLAPPLLVYGRPVLAFLMGLSRESRTAVHSLEGRARGVLRFVGHPVSVWTAFTGVLWLWHLPRLYQGALSSPVVHGFEHASFLVVGLAFWATVIGAGTRRRVSYAGALALAFLTMLPSVWLAMILSFSPRVVYPVYGSLPDQQLAGAIMWAPMAVATMVIVGALVVRWFRVLDRRVVEA